jgi:hypothetical protein
MGKIIFDREDMGKSVKNYKRGEMGKYRGDMKFPHAKQCGIGGNLC